jgi:hypothetical protein
MQVVNFKIEFNDLRDLIKKHNSSEFGKESIPVELFPNNINDIVSEIIKIHKREIELTKNESPKHGHRK